jgi:hypothetical protein
MLDGLCHHKTHFKKAVFLYASAEITVALLASLFVKYATMNEASLGGQITKLLLSIAPGLWGGGSGFGTADGCGIGGCVHKRLEGY